MKPKEMIEIYCDYCKRNHGANFHAIFTHDVHKELYQTYFVLYDKKPQNTKNLTNDIEYAIWWVKNNYPEMFNDHATKPCRFIYSDKEGISYAELDKIAKDFIFSLERQQKWGGSIYCHAHL